MKIYMQTLKDYETGKTREMPFVRFENGVKIPLAKYQESKKRQKFRRFVINKFYKL